MSGYTSIWLEDFEAGQHAVYGDHHFTREAVLAFARQYDPQSFHLDDEAAAKPTSSDCLRPGGTRRRPA
jgi:acyl dehydratase